MNEVVEVKPNTILSVPAVRRSVQKIKDAYGEKGYFLADVEYEVKPARENEVVVNFKITEHEPVTAVRWSRSSATNTSPTPSFGTRCKPATAASSRSARVARTGRTCSSATF